jgi:pyruvate ferredoxin oxidoreductase alpha subunit
MKKCIEGSKAVAQVVNLCSPDVVSAYPITPQTHIVEDLASLKANGDASFEFVRADSEFAAASIVLGASASGGRAYSASSSQGLLLMTEVLFSIAGMRLPVVLTCANRAISSPINIWNDQQDSQTVRDAGWLMLFAEDNQAACDLHILAFKLAEQLKIPAMVNMDGFVLTHTVEPVEVPEEKLIKKFLPAYKPVLGQILETEKPVSLGCFVTPTHYQKIRLELDADLKAAKKLFKKEANLFKKIFGREYDLVQYYGATNPETVMVSFGSVVGTIKDAVDDLNKKKAKFGVLNVVCYRPFPDEEVVKYLAKVKKIIVLEKDISLGSEGALSLEIKKSLYGKSKAKIISITTGLGGQDIRLIEIKNIFKK